ncbi:hypothetical protein NHQ30_004750 [Ciborinia camelliae]|nr:hypothetical protein NHQ30_004750 [Ciborinia camelliae]
MKSVLLLVTVAFVSLSSAHSGPAMPKLMGGREFLQKIKGRNAIPAPIASPVHVEERMPEIGPRANDPNTCGPGIGSCVNACCSPEGYCGTTKDYCAAPDCQFKYGPLCDTLQAPAGDSTASIARPHIGTVPYGGAGIYDCQVAGDIAFTFDDGPYLYTNDLLDKLAAYGAKATFMITGNNLGKGAIDTTAEYVAVIKRMVSEGHQIASHTWGHQNLTSLDPTTFKNQMIYNEMAFRNILGYFPTYMRPPYSECNNTCGDLLAALGYHVTYFDLDTEGYLNDSPTLIQNSKNIWDAAIATAKPATDNFLEIEHDIHYQTVYNLTDYILASMYSHGFKSVTVAPPFRHQAQLLRNQQAPKRFRLMEAAQVLLLVLDPASVTAVRNTDTVEAPPIIALPVANPSQEHVQHLPPPPPSPNLHPQLPHPPHPHPHPHLPHLPHPPHPPHPPNLPPPHPPPSQLQL